MPASLNPGFGIGAGMPASLNQGSGIGAGMPASLNQGSGIGAGMPASLNQGSGIGAGMPASLSEPFSWTTPQGAEVGVDPWVAATPNDATASRRIVTQNADW